MKKVEIILIISFAIFTACKEDTPISGCTDRNASNYTDMATIDDGSCKPYGTVRFVYIGPYYYSWVVKKNGISKYSNSNYIGNFPNISQIPTDCKSYCIQRHDANLDVGTYTYTVKRSTRQYVDTIVDSGNLLIEDGSCYIIRLNK